MKLKWSAVLVTGISSLFLVNPVVADEHNQSGNSVVSAIQALESKVAELENKTSEQQEAIEFLAVWQDSSTPNCRYLVSLSKS